MKRSLSQLLLLSCCCWRRPIASAQLKVVATTEDLGSLAREVGGDKVSVDGARQGLPGSALRRSEAELHPRGEPRRPADRRRPRAGDRLAAAAPDQQPQREDPAGRQGLSRRVAEREDPRDSRPARSRARWATCIRWAIRTTGSSPATAGGSRRRSATSSASSSPADKALLRAALRRLRQAAGRRREALGRDDGALQGHEDRDLSPLVAELHGALRPRA